MDLDSCDDDIMEGEVWCTSLVKFLVVETRREAMGSMVREGLIGVLEWWVVNFFQNKKAGDDGQQFEAQTVPPMISQDAYGQVTTYSGSIVCGSVGVPSGVGSGNEVAHAATEGQEVVVTYYSFKSNSNKVISYISSPPLDLASLAASSSATSSSESAIASCSCTYSSKISSSKSKEFSRMDVC
ncbi:hypothetical protein Tco_0626213 [Tanacetum coccineum]|uniref:Uncharacterized protein n=1 Tax=Tanacetum coccineum TaxID=301880 RepID=A0ABQ4WIX6_9ASTR